MFIAADALRSLQNNLLNMDSNGLENHISLIISKALEDKINTEDNSLSVNTKISIKHKSSTAFFKVAKTLEDLGYKVSVIQNSYYLVTYLIEW